MEDSVVAFQGAASQAATVKERQEVRRAVVAPEAVVVMAEPMVALRAALVAMAVMAPAAVRVGVTRSKQHSHRTPRTCTCRPRRLYWQSTKSCKVAVAIVVGLAAEQVAVADQELG